MNAGGLRAALSRSRKDALLPRVVQTAARMQSSFETRWALAALSPGPCTDSTTVLHSDRCDAARLAASTWDGLRPRANAATGQMVFGSSRLPGQQLVPPRGRQLGDAGKHIGEPDPRVDVVEIGGHDEGVHRRGALAANGSFYLSVLVDRKYLADEPAASLRGELDSDRHRTP